MNATPTPSHRRDTGAVTTQVDFFNATPNGDHLFSVRAGIPLGDAFDQLHLLLAAGDSAVEEICLTVSADAVPNSQWAAKHMLEFCSALAASIHKGFLESEGRKTALAQGEGSHRE